MVYFRENPNLNGYIGLHPFMETPKWKDEIIFDYPLIIKHGNGINLRSKWRFLVRKILETCFLDFPANHVWLLEPTVQPRKYKTCVSGWLVWLKKMWLKQCSKKRCFQSEEVYPANVTPSIQGVFLVQGGAPPVISWLKKSLLTIDPRYRSYKPS